MVKKGFSLTEALVVMAVLAIFFAFGAKVITTKPKSGNQSVTHGIYECYQSGGKTYQHYTLANNTPVPQEVTKCEFTPRLGAPVFNINAYITSTNCYSGNEPNINETFEVNFASGAIELKTDSATVSLTKDTDYNDISCSEIMTYVKLVHPRSKIYNEGNPLKGLIISW